MITQPRAKLYLSLVLLSVPLLLFSQGYWKEARIHFQNGDFILGQVREIRTAKLPAMIKYREGKGAKTQFCSPNEIKLLDFTAGKRYLRTQVKLDLSPVDLNKLQQVFKPKIVDTTILLMELATGKYNLYQFIDSNGKNHFFLSGPDSPIHELSYKVFWKNQDTRYVEREYGFRQELRKYATKCASISKIDAQPEYNKSDLLNYIRKLNYCE